VTRLSIPICLFLACLARPGFAAPRVSLVDGAVHEMTLLERVEGGRAILRKLVLVDGAPRIDEKADPVSVPLRSIVAATLPGQATEHSTDPFNVYRAGGDRLRGQVEGSGEELVFSSGAVSGLRMPLAEVEAVCLGTFFGQVQAAYRALFETQRATGQDAVVVNRGSKPFSFRANVVEIRKDALVVRMGEERRELARDKVFGFVRRGAERAPAAPGALVVRVQLADGGRLTLPFESLDADAVKAGGAVIRRDAVLGIEFGGDHVALLGSMEPVSVTEVALFGKAPSWRRDGMVLGGPLRMSGRVYERGIGVQAKSRLEYALGRRWNHLFVRCGIDDAASTEGLATFRVIGDGKVIKEVTRRKGEKPAVLHLDVSGVDRLVLEALPGDSYTSDLCDWAEARVYVREEGE